MRARWASRFLHSLLLHVTYCCNALHNLGYRLLSMGGRCSKAAASPLTVKQPGCKSKKETPGMTDSAYTVWELLASRYIHPESLQTFALLSSTHRELLRKLARTPSFWENLKATALRHALRSLDHTSLMVLKELTESPLMRPKSNVYVRMELDELGGRPQQPILFNHEDGPAKAIEEEVRRFLKLCCFPVNRVAACKLMLVIRNMQERGSEEDVLLMNKRVTWIIRKHCKKQVDVRGAYRLSVDSGHLTKGVSFTTSDVHKKKCGSGRRPNRPVLVVFNTQVDTDFVFARRGIFRRRLKLQLERCSMPWDMDARFNPGRREGLEKGGTSTKNAKYP